MITGERAVTPEAGFNPSWQRHRANYRLARGFLRAGPVLDVGCGVGHSLDLLAPLESVGVDIDPQALRGQERRTVVADIRELPFEDESFGALLALHSIEHVPDPERVVAEAHRVLRPGGVAVLSTPNRLTFGRPDEIIDPYHFVEFDPSELHDLCRKRFESVEMHGVFGSSRYMEFFRRERQRLDKVLRLDPLRLRRLAPRRLKRVAYDFMLTRSRRKADPLASSITLNDFALRRTNLDECLDVVAVCRR